MQSIMAPKDEIGFKKISVARFVPVTLAVLFLVGLTYGAISFGFLMNGQDSLKNAAQGLISSYANNIYQKSPVAFCCYSFSQILPFVLIAYLSGYSAIAQPITLMLLLLKGLITGFFMAGIYTSFGLKGAVFCGLVLVPNLLVSLFCLIIAARESISLSNMIFLSFTSNDLQKPTKPAVKLYNFKFGILFLILLGGALLELVCFLIFSGLVPLK